MKNILFVAFFMSLIILGSCSEEFFDKAPLGSLSETVFYNETGVEGLLVGAYGILSTSDQGGCLTNYPFGYASDDAYKATTRTGGAPFIPIEGWDVPTDNSIVEQRWEWAYDGVRRVNEVIRLTNRVDDMPVATRNRILGEAKFLRALFTFEAWRAFGNIPIITEKTDDPTLVSNINPEGAVLEHIISDLQFAWEKLPETQIHIGRPTKYTAMALAAKTYMQEVDYESAKPLLDNIINSGRYELMPNFNDNYRIETNNNQESLFEIQYSVDLMGNAGPGRRWGFPFGGDLNLGPGQNQPSQNLVNAFKVNENGLPKIETFNDEDLKHDMAITSASTFAPTDEPVDPRLDWTVSRRGIPLMDWGINRGMDWIREQSSAGPYLPAGPKYLHWHKHHGTAETIVDLGHRLSSNNFRYLRYAHVLLWRAEVAAFEGELEKARYYVNMVRKRAQNDPVMGRVIIYELPPEVYPWGIGTTHADYLSPDLSAIDFSQPAANYQVELYPPFSNQADAMKAVQFEFRLEFGYEGDRFFDLRRWDKLPENMRIDMIQTLNSFAEADQRIRTVMRGAVFIERDKYWPIPQSQIDLQPGVLKQNSGY